MTETRSRSRGDSACVELAGATEALDAIAGGPAAAILAADLRWHRAAARLLLGRLRAALAQRGVIAGRQ